MQLSGPSVQGAAGLDAAGRYPRRFMVSNGALARRFAGYFPFAWFADATTKKDQDLSQLD